MILRLRMTCFDVPTHRSIDYRYGRKLPCSVIFPNFVSVPTCRYLLLLWVRSIVLDAARWTSARLRLLPLLVTRSCCCSVLRCAITTNFVARDREARINGRRFWYKLYATVIACHIYTSYYRKICHILYRLAL